MFRRLPFSPPGAPVSPDSSGAFQVYNSDKRSVGLDVAHPGAREVVRRLVENSDVVIDNFGVGTMARLGFGADDLRAINPDIIVVSLSGYGQTGPTANYMAYGPAGGALAGLYAANGYENGPAAETGIAIGDPATGITAAWATMAARFATAELRRANEAVLDALIAAWTAGRDRWKTTRQLQAVGVAAFPSLSPRDLWNGDPQLNASGMLERPHHPRTGRRILPGVPWKLRHSPNGLRLPPPMLGQHTEDILAELGFTHPDIDQLLSRGVVYL